MDLSGIRTDPFKCYKQMSFKASVFQTSCSIKLSPTFCPDPLSNGLLAMCPWIRCTPCPKKLSKFVFVRTSSNFHQVHLAYIWIVSHLSAKNYRNLWNFDEVLTKTNVLSFFGTRCISLTCTVNSISYRTALLNFGSRLVTRDLHDEIFNFDIFINVMKFLEKNQSCFLNPLKLTTYVI